MADIDFKVNVDIQTTGKDKIDSLEKQIEKLKNTSVKLNIDLSGNGADFTKYFSNIEKQAQSAGKNIGNSFQQGMKSVKFNGNSEDFFTKYFEQQKKNIQEAKNVSKQYEVSQKDALKAVNARNSAEIKSNNESIKEQKRQQKEIEAIENARIKASENAKKREEKATLAQNKAINKSLEESYKKQQQEQQKQQQEQQKLNAQNLAQIRTAEESQKRIQVQQQIAAMKANAVQKNAHYNSLVQQGKDNIARIKQEYEDQSKYLQKYESYKTKLDNLKSTVSKDSSLLGSSGYDKITSQINQAEQAIQRFNTELAKGNNANFDNLTSDLKEINSLTKKATNEYEKLSSKASAIDQQNFINKLNKYAEANPRAVKAGQAQWNEMLSSAQSSSMTAGQLKNAELSLKQFDNQMQAAGKTGKSFFDEIKRGFIKIGEFAYTYGAIQNIGNAITSSVNELKDINTIVTEISKAADVPVKQLKDLETNSFSVASKYGQKASDYLLGVQEMTRAGYSDTNGMAELSTLAQSAGDMTAELANQYLIASDMAFGYGGNVEKLNSLLDSQNQITNRNAVNMTELANATKLVASQAAQSGVAEDEMTAALSTMIATTQQGGEIAARAFKGILMNLQQVTGELDDGEVIDETKLQKVEKRLTGVGVAMKEVKDGTVSLRDPMQVLEELAQVYNSLPDDSVEKAGIISDLGGKIYLVA